MYIEYFLLVEDEDSKRNINVKYLCSMCGAVILAAITSPIWPRNTHFVFILALLEGVNTSYAARW